MRRTLFLLIYLLFVNGFAGTASEEIITNTVERFLITVNSTDESELYKTDRLSKSSSNNIKSISQISDNLYLIQLLPVGFIICTNELDQSPVIAWSPDQEWRDDKSSLLMSFIKADYKKRQEFITSNPVAAAANRQKWVIDNTDDIPVSSIRFKQWPVPGHSATGGWIKTTWLQSAPFNNFCPQDPSTGQRSLTGCVATVMAQIVNYHQNLGPLQLLSSDGYVTETRHIEIDADSVSLGFPSLTSLNGYLEKISTKFINNQNLDTNETAALNFICGILLNMDFNSQNSGTYSGSLYLNLIQRLGFANARYLDPGNELYNRLKDNMMNGLPAHLSINKSVSPEGHSIVVDGYNTDGLFHLNFGWGTQYPDQIARVWYYLPEYIGGGYDVIQKGTVDIIPYNNTSPRLTPSDSVLVLGAAEINSVTAYKSVTFYNYNTESITIDYVLADGHFLAGYSLSSLQDSLGSVAIQPGGSKEIFVICTPDYFKRFDGELIVSVNNGEYFHAVSLIGYGVPVNATIVNEGLVSGTWRKEFSPVCILGDIEIAHGSTLKITAGVKVVALEAIQITAGQDCRLSVHGLPDEPVVFTARDTVNGWHGIDIINSGSDDTLDYCLIKNGIVLASAQYSTSGGALNIVSSSPLILNSIFANNSAAQGGAIAFDNSNAVLQNCKIQNNYSSLGTIFIKGYLAKPQIINSLFYNNEAVYSAVAEIDENAALTMVNCTLYNNLTSGVHGGLTLDKNNYVQLTNCIFYKNKTGSSEFFKFAGTGNRLDITWCDLDTVTSHWDLKNAQVGNKIGNIYKNPMFAHPAIGDFQLLTGSPCIDAGDPNMNVGNEVFPHGYRVNMGMFGGTAQATLTFGISLAVSPWPIDFGHLQPGDSKQLWLYLKNGSSGLVHVNAIMLSDSMNFSFPDYYNNGFTLASGMIDSLLIKCFTGNITEEEISAFVTVNTSEIGDISVPIRVIVSEGTAVTQNYVSGTWDAENSPYKIFNNITVPVNGKLIIKPGSHLVFMGKYGLNVGQDAQLIAMGALNDSVYFVPQNRDVGWNGINFSNSGQNDTLAFCVVENGSGLGNDDERNGGAVFSQNTGLVLQHCAFRHNQAQYGGALYVSANKVTVSYCEIENNYASRYGGGIYLANAELKLDHTLLTYNESRYDGGAMSVHDSSRIELLNVTIADNITAGRGGNIYLTDKNKLFFTNSIIWKSEGRYAHNFYIEMRPGHDTVEFNYSCIDTSENWLEFGGINENEILWGIGNIAIDPMFVNAADKDYTLLSGSPCIDAGDPGVTWQDMEDTGHPGYALWPSMGTLRNDMGRFGGGGINGLIYQFTQPGWQLVSTPFSGSANSFSAILPGYHYAIKWAPVDGVYKICTTGDSLNGFWIYSAQAAEIEKYDLPVEEWTTHCLPGWYLLGSVGVVTPVSSIKTEPENSLAAVFTWDPVAKIYRQATLIKPGKGYWYAILNECDLTLSANADVLGKSLIDSEKLLGLFRQAYASYPPAPPDIQLIAEKSLFNYSLSQNYPNPFNPDTFIDYTIPKDGLVQVQIYNILGQVVRTLVNKYETVGKHSVLWDGKTESGEPVSSGIYFYKMKCGDFVTVKKMALMR